MIKCTLLSVTNFKHKRKMQGAGSSFINQGASFIGDKNTELDDDNNDEFKVHEGIIFAIHLTPTMYQNLETLFENILKLLKKLAKSLPNTGLGCYLFNSSKENIKSKDAIHVIPEGIYKIFRLQDINQEPFKIVDRILKDSKRMDSFYNTTGNIWETMFPMLDDNPVNNFSTQLFRVLKQCGDDFRFLPKFVSEYNSRKLFLFTDCYKPFNGNVTMRNELQNKLKGLDEDRITVYPFLVPNPRSKTDTAEFKILFEIPHNNDDDGPNYIPSTAQISLDKIEEKIMKTAEVKRVTFHCPLEFSSLKMSVKGISMFSSVDNKKVKFYNYNNRLKYVKKNIRKLVEDKIINKENTVKVVKISDQYLPVNYKDDFDDLTMFGQVEKPILKILGTRNLKFFNPSYTMRAAILIVADEYGEYSHSLRTFSALYVSLVKNKKMALCWGMPRKISYPRLYYLIPTDKSLKFDTNLDPYPQGLAMVEIPYGDEIKTTPQYVNELDAPEEIDDSHILDKLLRGLKLERFESLENPKLSWQFKIIEDHILQVEVPKTDKPAEIVLQYEQNETDQLQRKVMEVREKIEDSPELSQLMRDLNTRYNRIANEQELCSNDNIDTRPRKMAKLEKQLTDNIIIVAVKNNSLSSFTVNHLKNYVSSKSGAIKNGKNKTEIINNIMEYLENNNLLD